jgi:P-type Cu2+ transporter
MQLLGATLASMQIAHAELPVSQDVAESSQDAGQEWAACDAPEVWQAFSQLLKNEGSTEAPVWQSRLQVQGMHCSACAGIVERALLAVPGVQAAQINAMSARVLVTWNPAITQPSRWITAVSAAGYAMLPIQGDDALTKAKRDSRTMLWRWLVAGFCMMQVMMYAWPNYSALPGEMDSLSDSLLRWASWLLTLPVLLFSSQPFFAAAGHALGQRRITMDVPVALGIALTFLVSTVAVWQPQGPWGSELYLDSLTMLVFFLLTGRWIEARLRVNIASDLEAASAQLPLAVQRIDAQGGVHTVPIHSVGVGDVVLVRKGESFAVDGCIVQGATTADESLLTGESQAVAKQLGDGVVAGSVNVQATVHIRATQVGQDTRFAQIAQLMAHSESDKPLVVQLADRVAQPFLWIVLTLATGALLFWWPQDPHRAVLSAIAVLIVTCPCALALAAPAAFLSSASALARAGVIVRKLSAIERMSQVTSMLFDKTGTLTLAGMKVSGVRWADRAELKQGAKQGLQLVSQMTEGSLHPVSQTLHAYAKQFLPSDITPVALTVEEVAGAGLLARDSLGHTWRLGSAQWSGLADSEQSKQVHLTDAQGWLARFELQEHVRPDAAKALDTIRHALSKKAGRVEIASGDQPAAVRAVAHALLLPPSHAHAQCQAQDKLALLQGMRQRGQIVAMMGDGINDAPVLAAADVSIAPAQGASMAMVKSDFILTAQSLWPVAQIQPHALRTMRIVRQNLYWALAYNMVCVPLAWMGWLAPWMAGLGMALSSILVLLNALRLRKIS